MSLLNRKKDLIPANEQSQLQPISESASLLQAIVSASSNEKVDVEKMERLWAMKEKIDDKEAEMQFNIAMTEAQTYMRPISADATNPQTRSMYASYAKLDGALRPIYSDAGFALSFDTGDSPKELYVRVLCYLSHKSGHSRTHHIDMPADGKGAKGGDVMTKTHATGAGVSYGMRYLLKMIFNVAVGEDDRDGNTPFPAISEEQVNEINAAINENSLSMPRFLGWLKQALKVNNITEINVNAYNVVMLQIKDSIKAREKKANENAKN